MRIVCGLVFALCLAPALHSEENALLDYEFTHAAEDGKVSVREMLRRLTAAMPSIGKPAGAEGLYFAETYAAATKRAKGAELDELAGVLRAMPADSLYFEECFSVYATATIRRRVAQLARKPVRLEWEPSAEPMPKELADAPAPFRDAWKLHRKVIAPYLAVVVPLEKADAPRKKVPSLEVDLRRVVGKPEPEAWKHLVAQVWGSWCGTGSEMLYHPRNRALLLSFLADGKLHEAAGAALEQVPSISLSGDEDRFESLAVDLLTALGLDWEQVMFGSLLPVTSYNMANRRPVVSGAFTECDAWRLLAARGSERAVRQCLDLIRWAKLDPRNAGEFLAAALGPEPARPGVFTISTDTRPVRRVALPRPSRSEVVSVLAEYLAPTNSPADLVEAMGEVPSHCVKDLRKPLAALVSHRVHAVAAKAHGLLDEAGLTSGQEKIASATPPLHFRMLLNGKPLSDVKVSVDAIAKRAPGAKGKSATPLGAYVTIIVSPEPGDGEQPFSRAVAPSQDLTTDGNGEIRYSLEECLEPERIAAVQFRIGPPSYSSERDDELAPPFPEQAPKQRDNEWPGPWIVHQVGVRAGDERVHEIELRGADMEVKLAAFDEITTEKPIKLMLRRANSREPFSPDAGVAKAMAKVGSSAFFRRLQPGKYTLCIKMPGAARYDSGEITVGDAAVTHDVKLEPGRNVRGTAAFPDGTKSSLVLHARLFRDGVEMPRDDIDEWKGLAFGKYTARIPSTREWEEEAKKAGYPVNRVPEEDRIDACEVSFVIDTSTPATLNLREVIVPREKR